jgi:hypothetical protein
MKNEYMYTLSESQMVQFEGLQLQHAEIKRFEEQEHIYYLLVAPQNFEYMAT